MQVSREIPTQAICRVLGVPEEDRLMFADWTDRGIEAPSDAVIAEEYVRKARRYAQGLIETKRVQPQSDIFSTIVQARFDTDGSTLSDHELWDSGTGYLSPAITGDQEAVPETSNPAAHSGAGPRVIPEPECKWDWSLHRACQRRARRATVCLRIFGESSAMHIEPFHIHIVDAFILCTRVRRARTR